MGTIDESPVPYEPMDEARAAMYASPSWRASAAQEALKSDMPWQDLCLELERQNAELEGGDMSSVTATLRCQLSTLDLLFNQSVRKATIQESPAWASLHFQVALKAQAQSSRTAAAIGRIKANPVVVVDAKADTIDVECPDPANLVRLAISESESSPHGEELDAAGEG